MGEMERERMMGSEEEIRKAELRKER